MQSNESDGDNSTNASFWKPHQYSRTVKRVENANKLCSELALMIQERSDIEKAYAANLRKFASRLDMFLKSGLEYGSGANIISGLAKEAEDTAELHSNIAADLINPVQLGIKNWQKENFHKHSISSSLKEVKNFDSDFENAQKTWYKNYKQVNRCKKDYFHACKVVRSLQVQVQNAKNEPFGTPEQQAHRAKELRKMEDKLRKATIEEQKTRRAYEEAITSLNDVTPRYMDDMTQVFNRAQAFERERLIYFKQQALLMQEVLDIASKPSLPQVFAKMRETLSKVDADADLKKWSLEHGVDMPTNFPTFQEYSPELCALGKKGKSAVADGNSAGVTLTSMKVIASPDRPTSSASGAEPGSTSSPLHTAGGYNDDVNYDNGVDDAPLSNSNRTDTMDMQSTNLDSPTEAPKYPEPLTSDVERSGTTEEHLIIPTRVEARINQVPRYLDSGVSISAAKRLRSPSSIQSEEPAEDSTKLPSDGYNSSINGGTSATIQPATENVAPYPDLIDDGRPGLPVRALYDYVGVEADELSFNTGDLFEKLEDEDEQGWCKGRKDGRVGLYPANYVQTV